MNKIASPDQLRAELTTLLEYSQGPTPSRARLASRLRRLAEGVDKTAASTPWSAPLLDWMSDVLKDIVKAATSSKGFKLTSDRGQRSSGGSGFAHRFSGETAQGTADVDISVSWNRDSVVVFGSYHVGAEVSPIYGSNGATIGFDASPARVIATAKGFFNGL